MRQSVVHFSAVLVVLAAACGEPTGTQSGAIPARGFSHVVTASQGTISKLQGDQLIAQTGVGVVQDPTVRVVDLSGTPIAGEAVTFTASNGSTLFAGLATYTVNTNANGMAATIWTLGTIGGQTLVATVGVGGISTTFDAIATTSGAVPTIAKLQGDAVGQNNNIMAGRATTTSPTVEVIDAGTAARLNRVKLTFTAGGNGSVGNSAVTTDANGLAATTWTFSTTAGTQTLDVRTVALYNTAGAWVSSARFSVVSLGNATQLISFRGQGGTATTALNARFGTKDFAVRLLTAANVAVPSIKVLASFGANSNDCSISLGFTNTYEGGKTVLYTNALGVAATPVCNATAGFVGTHTVTFSVAGVSDVAITGTSAGVAAALNTVWGDNQTVTVGNVSLQDPTVRLVDANGGRVVGGAVTITASGNGTVENFGTSGKTITVNSDAQGNVAARWTQGTVSGAQTVVFTLVSNGAITQTLNSTANPDVPAQITRLQSEVLLNGGANTQTTKDPAVRVLDRYLNRITTAVNVTFTPSTGSRMFVVSRGSGPFVALTGSNYGGQLASDVAMPWTVGTTGTYTLTVSATGVPSITFSSVVP